VRNGKQCLFFFKKNNRDKENILLLPGLSPLSPCDPCLNHAPPATSTSFIDFALNKPTLYPSPSPDLPVQSMIERDSRAHVREAIWLFSGNRCSRGTLSDLEDLDLKQEAAVWRDAPSREPTAAG